MTFLTKQEIIEKLQSLPDLPVVFQLDCDVLCSSGVRSVEVVEAVKGSHYESDQEYNVWGTHEYDEKVILIS